MVLIFNLFINKGKGEEMTIPIPWVMESWTKKKLKRVKSKEKSDKNSERLPDDQSDGNDRPNNIISDNIISEEKQEKEEFAEVEGDVLIT